MTVHRNTVSYELGRHLEQGPREELSPPAPRDKLARWDFNVLQVNLSGFQNKQVELMKMLKDNNINIALIQETILPDKMTIVATGYTAYKCNCNKCQGIMTLVRNDTQAVVENTPSGDVDIQKVTTWINNIAFVFLNVIGQHLIHQATF